MIGCSAAGADHLHGEAGRDRLADGADRDTPDGGEGQDTLDGGDGQDLLLGGADLDLLVGGAGNDIFLLAATADSPVTPGGARDRIMDFTPEQDAISLDLDANEIVAGVQDFALMTTGFAANRPGEVRIVAVNGGAWLVLGNSDNDAQAEFALAVMGGAPTAADLIL